MGKQKENKLKYPLKTETTCKTNTSTMPPPRPTRDTSQEMPSSADSPQEETTHTTISSPTQSLPTRLPPLAQGEPATITRTAHSSSLVSTSSPETTPELTSIVLTLPREPSTRTPSTHHRRRS